MLLQAVLAALGRCMPGLVLARIGKATYRCVERAVAQAVVLVQAVDAALGRSLLASLCHGGLITYMTCQDARHVAPPSILGNSE